MMLTAAGGVRRLGLRPVPAALFALTVAMLVAMVFLSLGVEPLYDTVLYGLMTLALGAAGMLIASRASDNPIGWVFCCMAVFSALEELAQAYGKHEAFAGAEPAEWFASWAWAVAAGLWTIVFVLFPSGRLPSRRWRIVLWAALAGAALIAAGSAFGHAADSAFASGENPYAIGGIGAEAAYIVGQVLFLTAFLAAVASLIVRFRRSAGVERQQLKWIAYAVSAFAVVGPLAAVAYHDSVLVQVAIAIVVTSVPAAVCIAILRYRLYDIDVVINRTLVYGALTATLAGIYLASVLLLQLVLSGVTADSSLAVAASTLAVAALFQPARGRIQHAVDRRFYRQKYDAARTLEAFGARLRDEVDLDALGAELRAVVAQTMQPQHVSLWLRPADLPPGGQIPSGAG
ncbi:MAG: hypothetical protein M3N04_07835, partial [Actinomycetota bacterium]|nr:hypothetical protein [Actinomycetota bacterium]